MTIKDGIDTTGFFNDDAFLKTSEDARDGDEGGPDHFGSPDAYKSAMEPFIAAWEKQHATSKWTEQAEKARKLEQWEDCSKTTRTKVVSDDEEKKIAEEIDDDEGIGAMMTRNVDTDVVVDIGSMTLRVWREDAHWIMRVDSKVEGPWSEMGDTEFTAENADEARLKALRYLQGYFTGMMLAVTEAIRCTEQRALPNKH